MTRALIIAGALLGLGLTARTAAAQDEPVLTGSAAGAACEAAADGEHDRLYSIVIDRGWRFDAVETELGDDGSVVSSFLAIDTRRNLRALRGRVELLPSGLEAIGFVASDARALELEAAREHGASLRVGFFLGFDEPVRSACLVRGSHGVTTLRADVAFVELVASDGSVVAREDTDRYAAWSDDRERTGIAGTGPRAEVGNATLPSGARVPEAWQSALTSETVRSGLSRCHGEGIARGATPDALARVRVAVDARTGHVASARVELTNLGDATEAECIEGVLGAAALPAGPIELPARVDLGATIRFAD